MVIEDKPIVQIIAVAAIFVSGIIYLIYLYRQAKIAREASVAKSGFLSQMSHEIRTPMNAITGMAELLLRGELSDEARGYTQDIKQAGNNLVSIINDILGFFWGERFRNVPIVALTASAVVGMREMFIENGFNDFLAKPIDVSKLDEMLSRWIPREKRTNSK